MQIMDRRFVLMSEGKTNELAIHQNRHKYTLNIEGFLNDFSSLYYHRWIFGFVEFAEPVGE